MARLKREEMPEEAAYKQLDPESEGVKRLIAYLCEEHRRSLSAHEEYFNDLRMYRRAIAAKPAVKVKTFPWVGASNFIAPIIRIAGDAVKARVVNTLLGPKPFWVVTTPSGTFAPYAKPWEKFLNWSFDNDLNMTETAEMIADQVVYLGKCPVKIFWDQEVKKVRTYDRKSKEVVYYTKTVRDQPTLMPILLENWLEPWGIEKAEDKPWNSHRVFLRVGDLIERERAGLISNSAKVRESCSSYLPPDMQELAEIRKLAWADTQVLSFYETFVQFDVDNDGWREELVVLWNYELETVLSARYMFFHHGKRPIKVFYYLRGSDSRTYSDGLAQLLWPIQDAMSTFINQRTDNITIANTRYFKGKKNSGIKKGEQIWPGKVLLMDDPTNDLIGDRLGDVSPSSFTHESILRDYGERLSGISDPQLGREFDNPRVAATTTLSILQEGNRRFDMIIRLMRKVFSEIGVQVSQLYQQFDPRVELSEILSPEEELYVREILSQSPETIEKNFFLQVNASSASVNKETERQALLALFNLISQFYAQVIQVAQQIMINPQVPEPIKDMIIEMADSSYRTLKEIIASYDKSDPETFLVDVGEALRFVKSGGGVESMEQQIQQGLQQFQENAGIPAQQGANNSNISPNVAFQPEPGAEVPIAEGQPTAQAIS